MEFYEYAYIFWTEKYPMFENILTFFPFSTPAISTADFQSTPVKISLLYHTVISSSRIASGSESLASSFATKHIRPANLLSFINCRPYHKIQYAYCRRHSKIGFKVKAITTHYSNHVNRIIIIIVIIIIIINVVLNIF